MRKRASNHPFHQCQVCLALGAALGFWALVPVAVHAQQLGAGTVDFATTADRPQKQVLYLSQGGQQTLWPTFTPGRIAVANPAVLDVRVLPAKSAQGAQPVGHAQLLLTAKGMGSTSLLLWPEGGGAVQEWEVKVAGAQLILERRLRSAGEHAGLLATYRESLPKGMALVDRTQVEVRSDTVQVDVQVVEFKKTAMKKIGMNFSSGGANDKGFNFGLYNPASGEGSSPFADAMNLVLGFGKAFSGAGIAARLSLLEGNGLARILARPTLVAHSGQSASFLAGGELPIPVSSKDGNIGIEYKEFGVKLQLTPTVIANDRIALKVAPESSDLDFSNSVAVGGVYVPAIRTRRVDTMIELGDGESFIIGGLVSRSTSSNVNKVPLLGDLPVLGSFFKNLSYSQDETELVIVVTPSLVQPLQAGVDLQAHLPGHATERRNARGVWGDYMAGAARPHGAMPGFSY